MSERASALVTPSRVSKSASPLTASLASFKPFRSKSSSPSERERSASPDRTCNVFMTVTLSVWLRPIFKEVLVGVKRSSTVRVTEIYDHNHSQISEPIHRPPSMRLLHASIDGFVDESRDLVDVYSRKVLVACMPRRNPPGELARLPLRHCWRRIIFVRIAVSQPRLPFAARSGG